MLMHIVCFKYHPGTSAEQRRAHRERLAALAALDGILDLKVGADLVGSARSYDTGLIVTFPDRAALDAYQQHPQHLPVAQLGAGLCESIVAVDFDV
jgi:hypothetical protein